MFKAYQYNTCISASYMDSCNQTVLLVVNWTTLILLSVSDYSSSSKKGQAFSPFGLQI